MWSMEAFKDQSTLGKRTAPLIVPASALEKRTALLIVPASARKWAGA